MQIGRLFEIVYLLLNKKGTTAKELAERFGVSVRTIYRDIDTLSLSGIPIYTVQGSGGGIFIDSDFVLNKSLLTAEEQEQILLALQTMPVTGNAQTEQLLSRLGHLFQKQQTDWISVDFSRWGSTSADQQKFDLLLAAIPARQTVHFSYVSTYSSLSEKTVYPLKLLFKSRAWYLQAYDPKKEAFRLYKLSRMSGVSASDGSFDHLSLPPTPHIDMFESAPPSVIDLVVRFTPRVAYRVYDEFDLNDISPDGAGYFIVKKTLPEDGWLYGYILSFGTDAEVIAPAEMRARMHALTGEIKRIYDT